MKTKELIEKVKELGFEVKDTCDYIIVIDDERSEIASVEKVHEYSLETFYYKFDELDKETKKKLFNLMVEYASTPVEEREEEKKYYLRHRWIDRDNDYGYVNMCLCDERVRLYNNVDAKGWRTQFTQKEIDEIKEKLNTNLEDFEIVEVEE